VRKWLQGLLDLTLVEQLAWGEFGGDAEESAKEASGSGSYLPKNVIFGNYGLSGGKVAEPDFSGSSLMDCACCHKRALIYFLKAEFSLPIGRRLVYSQ
jgi:hypothetical protein